MRHVMSAALALLALAVLPAAGTLAAPLSATQVQAAVATWVSEVAPEGRPTVVVTGCDPYPAEGRPAAYVVQLAGGGYCLAGADDRLLPVAAYQPSDPYDERIPDLRYVLDDYARRLARLEQATATNDPTLAAIASALAERREDWQALIQGRRPPHMGMAYGSTVHLGTPDTRTIPPHLELPLTTRWHQRSPYNDECPVLTPGSDEHTVVGCVATAAVQIMAYWRWPPTMEDGLSVVDYPRYYTNGWISEPLAAGVNIPDSFAGRLEWTADDGGRLRLNGYWDNSLHEAAVKITPYVHYQTALANLWQRLTPDPSHDVVVHDGVSIDWSLLQDVHADPPDAGDAEAAKLCYHLGAAIDMDYGVLGSGSSIANTPAALRDLYRYDRDIAVQAPETWCFLDDLSWMRPLQLGGYNDEGGHAWVVQGYDTSTDPPQYLMNYGWGGAPAWALLDDIFPNGQSIVRLTAPAGVVRFVGSPTAGDGSPSAPFADLAAAAAAAPDGATLIFRAGSDNTFPGSSLTITRPMTLKGIGVTVRPS